MFLDLFIWYEAEETNRQSFAFITKYSLHHLAVRTVAANYRFRTQNLAHSSAKGVGCLRNPLRFLNQSPQVSKSQPTVGVLRYSFRYRNPARNVPNRNFLGIPFENAALQIF